jgi:hypothetical protein
VVSTTPRPLYPRKDPVPIVQKAGWAPGPVWMCAKNLAPTGIFLNVLYCHFIITIILLEHFSGYLMPFSHYMKTTIFCLTLYQNFTTHRGICLLCMLFGSDCSISTLLCACSLYSSLETVFSVFVSGSILIVRLST